MNVRPDQKGCRGGPLVPTSAPPPRCLPAPSLFPRPAPRSCALRKHLLPAQARPCGPASRWVSAAAIPATHTLPVACTPADSPLNVCVTVRLLSLPSLRRLPPCPCSRPPAVYLHS